MPGKKVSCTLPVKSQIINKHTSSKGKKNRSKQAQKQARGKKKQRKENEQMMNEWMDGLVGWLVD